LEQIKSVINKIKQQGLTLSLAESCTGGKVASTIVSFEGVSDFFLGGVVSYSINSKITILNIDGDKIKNYGVVSSEIAKEMSIGAKKLFKSDISVAVTGNVGLNSADDKSSVGKVFVAINSNNKVEAWEFNFNGNRKTNIESAVSEVFKLLNNIL
tara:strand:+ start:177 stop:641 length:465 start_codon:yes stop_codon:yes gene_type:complete